MKNLKFIKMTRQGRAIMNKTLELKKGMLVNLGRFYNVTGALQGLFWVIPSLGLLISILFAKNIYKLNDKTIICFLLINIDSIKIIIQLPKVFSKLMNLQTYLNRINRFINSRNPKKFFNIIHSQD